MAGVYYTPAWQGARNAACGTALPRQSNIAGTQTGMASSFPPAARREILLGPAGLWSLLSVSQPVAVEVEVGGAARSPWELHNLIHCKKEAGCRAFAQRKVSSKYKLIPVLLPPPGPHIASPPQGPLRCLTPTRDQGGTSQKATLSRVSTVVTQVFGEHLL